MTASILALAPVSHVEASWGHPLSRRAYEALGRCETGLRAGNTRHSTRSYVGAFGVARTTWAAYADAPASRAPRLDWDTQARVLDRIFFWGHTENGRYLYAAGPWGHGCFKKLRFVQLEVCRSHKWRVRKWCR